jgi:hypothetical protein
MDELTEAARETVGGLKETVQHAAEAAGLPRPWPQPQSAGAGSM